MFVQGDFLCTPQTFVSIHCRKNTDISSSHLRDGFKNMIWRAISGKYRTHEWIDVVLNVTFEERNSNIEDTSSEPQCGIEQPHSHSPACCCEVVPSRFIGWCLMMFPGRAMILDSIHLRITNVTPQEAEPQNFAASSQC